MSWDKTLLLHGSINDVNQIHCIEIKTKVEINGMSSEKAAGHNTTFKEHFDPILFREKFLNGLKCIKIFLETTKQVAGIIVDSQHLVFWKNKKNDVEEGIYKKTVLSLCSARFTIHTH